MGQDDEPSASTTSIVDFSHPLYLHPSDTEATTLVSQVLRGSENYEVWSRSMRIALSAKNKLGIIDGTCLREKQDPLIRSLWDRCNSVILSWLINSVDKNLATAIVFSNSARSVWLELKDRFHKPDGTRIFSIHKAIGGLIQGPMTVSEYFTKLNDLWDEYDSLVPFPTCQCSASQEHSKIVQQQRLLQFLMGLNDKNDYTRTQILHQSPLPTVSQAYSIISQDEAQRLVSYHSNGPTAGVTMTARGGRTRRGRGTGRTSQYHCSFCNRHGHKREYCYQLGGFPPGRWSQDFEKLLEQVKAVSIDSAVTLTGIVSQIFENALMEPASCEMYASFCSYLAAELPIFSEDNQIITFKRLLANKCQEEFERGQREPEKANKDDEGTVKLSAEEREEKRVKARRRKLGNIRLIGELYKQRMLVEKIMHHCINTLLGSEQDPDEEDIEALYELMSTIGEMIDRPKDKEHMDAYFERMKLLSNNMNLSSRVRFMMKYAIDLRKNKWQQKRKVEGPKIEEVHRDAAQERQAQTGRLGCDPGNTSSSGMPMEFCPRGSSVLSTPITPLGMRGFSAQGHSGGSQDVHQGDKLLYEATLSVPLPQRPLGGDSVTLGSQGGLAREVSFIGPSVIPSSGLNYYSGSSERALYSSREDLMPRYATDRFDGPTVHGESAALDRNAVSENSLSEKVWPEEHLRDMSMAAIKEYYSARDVKEVALCVNDLKSPSYHPSMVSLWVTDSFERNDIERDFLAKLLVSLAKSHDGTLSQAQLIKGFDSILSGLEDAVNDAPRAPKFLGRIFARVVIENVVSLKDIVQLLYEGGEKPGRLLEIGLAGDVLGSTFEAILMEKGDAVLSEILSNSNLRLEPFRPPKEKEC